MAIANTMQMSGICLSHEDHCVITHNTTVLLVIVPAARLLAGLREASHSGSPENRASFPDSGLILSFIPIAFSPLSPIPRWLLIKAGIAIVACTSLGNFCIAIATIIGPPATIVQTMLLLSIPPCVVACLVFQTSRTHHPDSMSVMQPLFWAFGSLLLSSAGLTFITIVYRATPLKAR